MLSAALRAALIERCPSEAMFSQVRADGSTSKRETVSMAVWLRFSQAMRSLIEPISDDGASPCCHVGLMCRETFYACLVESACLCLGMVFCVFNPDEPLRRREYLLSQRSPQVIVTDASVAEMLRKAQCEDADHDADDSRGNTLEARMPVVVDDTSIAYYIHTSGSTGFPKCVAATRMNLFSYASEFSLHPDGLGAGDHSVFLTLSTPFFDPSIGDMISVLMSKHGQLVTVPRQSIVDGQLSALLASPVSFSSFPTHIVSTPAVWKTVSVAVCRSAFTSAEPSPVKVFLGGEKMTQAIVDEWASMVELYNIYGVTEVTVYQSLERVLPSTLAADVTCGSMVGSTSVLIEGAEADDKGGVGEVVLRGPQVCHGYVDAAGSGGFGRCAESGDPIFRTGDLGRLVPVKGGKSALVLLGRKDWQIKVNGQRVSIEEAEQAILGALGASIRECCCCAMTETNNKSGESTVRIGAAIVVDSSCLDDDISDHRDGIQTAIQQLLELYIPMHMLPTRWLVLAGDQSLPQTPTGKRDRGAVAQQIEAFVKKQQRELSDPSDDAGGDDELYKVVRNAWQSFFGFEVSSRTNFFYAGGDSLGALKLTREVYVSVHGSDAGIDCYGGLPSPFQPHVLMRHPCLGAYVAALRSEVEELLPDRFPHQSSPTQNAAGATLPTADAALPQSSRERSVLLDVVAAGCERLAHLLLDHHLCDVNGQYTREHRCATPLHVAVSSANCRGPEMALLLLRRGAHVTAVTRDGVTPAHLAAARDVDALKLLFQHGAVPQARDARQQSLLHFASRSGNTEAVRFLLWECGADLTTRDKWQRTAAHWAALNSHDSALRVMSEFLDVHPAGTVTATAEGSRKRLRRGGGKERFARLAKRRTHLAYESLEDICMRICPENADMRALCTRIAEVVEE